MKKIKKIKKEKTEFQSEILLALKIYSTIIIFANWLFNFIILIIFLINR